MAVKITPARFVTSGKAAIIVESPYHPDFPERARQLGGSWNTTKRHWAFDVRDEADVRTLCIEIYGTDGSSDVQVVDVEVRINGLNTGGELWLFGRELARSFGHGRQVRLGDGVRVLSGSLPGSAVLLVRDVPVSLVDQSNKDIHIHEPAPYAAPPAPRLTGDIPDVFRAAFGDEQ